MAHMICMLLNCLPVVPDPHHSAHDLLDHPALRRRVVEVGESRDVAPGQLGRSVDALRLHGRQGQLQATVGRGFLVSLDCELLILEFRR